MFAVISNDAERAAFEAQRGKATVQLAASHRESQINVKEGAITLQGIFLSNLPPSKAGAAVAAAGQNGEKAKDPPVRMNVIVFVRPLCTTQAPGLEYEIIDHETIRIPARNNTAISDWRKVKERLFKYIMSRL